MAQIPDEVKLEPGEYARLMKINADINSLQRLMDMLVENVRAKMNQANLDGQVFWQELAKKYGLDIKHTNWEPHHIEAKLIPTLHRFPPPYEPQPRIKMDN